MGWAARKKALYLSIIFVILASVVAVPIIWTWEDEATCSDGEQNQGEVGVDCGGPCRLLCPSQVQRLQVLWGRAFKVNESRYNALAFVENPNFNAAVESIAYSFQVFDEENLLIAERTGRTYITNDGITPIFESGIITGNRTPARTIFKLLEQPRWQRIPEQPNLVIENQQLLQADTEPRVEATLRNEEAFDVHNIEIVIALFDQDENAIAGSQTFVSRLDAGASKQIFFTWPEPFEARVSRMDIIPRIPPGR